AAPYRPQDYHTTSGRTKRGQVHHPCGDRKRGPGEGPGQESHRRRRPEVCQEATMTQRERKLAFGALGAAVLLAGGLFVYQGLLEPLAKTKTAIATLEEEIDSRDIELFQRMKDHRELARLKALSLPTDPDPRHLAFDGAWTSYDKYLRDLMKQ